jgi:hypothetical protein
MDNKDKLKSMLQNFIGDNQEAAQLDFHSYMSDKMQEVSGFKEQKTVVEVEDEEETNEENE